MRRGGHESEPRSQIQLQDNQIFLGPDGIALTNFGSTVQKLLINAHTLSLSRNGDSITEERRRQIQIEVSDLCSEVGIPNNKAVIKETARQFRQIVDARMSLLSMSSFSTNGHESSG